MEVFNSSSKAINKVIDDQGNWVPISNTDFAYGRSVCVAAIDEMNIFVAAGALVLNNTRCESLNSLSAPFFRLTLFLSASKVNSKPVIIIVLFYFSATMYPSSSIAMFHTDTK